jgi:hypothetical protein
MADCDVEGQDCGAKCGKFGLDVTHLSLQVWFWLLA